MGLFDKVISGATNAIGEGIGKGVRDAVGNAVGGAVESAVRPAADRYAGAVANQMDATTAALNESAAALNNANAQMAAQNAAAPAAAATAAQGSGFDSLMGSLANYANTMEARATEMAKNFKECPQCGETCDKERSYCPSCGAKLPDQVMTDGLVCPRCGKQNTLDTRFCADCGTPLPKYAAEIEEERQLREAEERNERYLREVAARKEAEAAAREAQRAQMNAPWKAAEDGINDLKGKAADIGGAAVGSVLGGLGGLFGKK